MELPQTNQAIIPEDKETKEEAKSARFEMIAGVIIAVFTAILALSGLAGDSYGEGILIANGEKASAYDWYNSKSIKQILSEGQKETLEALLISGELKIDTIQDIKNNLNKLDELVTVNQSEIEKIITESKEKDIPKTSPSPIDEQTLWKTFGALEALVNSQSLTDTTQDNINKYLENLDTKIEKYKNEKNEILVGSGNLPEEKWVQDVDGELGQVIGAQEWESDLEILNEAGSKMDLSGLFLEICLVLGAISLVMQRPGSKWIFLSFSIIVGLIGTSFMIWGLTILWPF